MLQYDTFEAKAYEPGKYNAIILTAEVVKKIFTSKEGVDEEVTQLEVKFDLENPDGGKNISCTAWCKPQISEKYPLFKSLVELVATPDKKGVFDETLLQDKECVAECGVNAKGYLSVVDVAKKN